MFKAFAHPAAEPLAIQMVDSELQAGYDSVAEHYATDYFDELERKPFDRELLDSFAAEVLKSNPSGVVCELGCGPGQVARYLKDRGVEMRGIDLSSAMVRVAGRLNPDVPFSQGDLMALDIRSDSLAAVVLFYSIIHIERNDVIKALREIYRILRPGGTMLLAFHAGDGEIHRDEWYGKMVSIDFRLFQPEEMSRYFEAAGFVDISTVEREPYEFEYATRRIYMFAKK